jgi:flagellar protein FliS
MFGSNNRKGASAYANVGVETGVMAASPHKLIVMLFEGALVALSSALVHMEAKNIAAKGKSISKAISIIDNGLRASLDKNVGGEIALNLDALYTYMSDRLLQANLNNSPEMVQEVAKLLGELKDAWESIAPAANAAAAPAAAERPQAAAYDALSPRTGAFASA